jgi:kinetochore protein NDC80
MMPRVDGGENIIPPSPGGSSVTAPTASSRRRSSFGGPLDRRKSLAPPPPLPPTVKSDPRPINDKVFQQECIKNLLAFLLESGYDQPISHKALLRPSSKDFSNMCTFMLRLVDPNFQNGVMKFEDEVALNFKCVGYPYTVSKTALVAAGAQHTWAALLSALSWLSDHIRSKKEANPRNESDDKPFESLQELEIKTDRAFFSYLGQAYMAYMRNNVQMTEKLESALADRFERDDGYLFQELERVTDLNAAIVERINALTQDTQE